MPVPRFLPRPIHQDAPHGFRGGGKEMAATVPVDFVGFGKAQPGFMHKGSGLQGLAGRFVGHTCGRQFAQFVVDQWQQLLSGLRLALLNAIEDARDLIHRVSSK